MQKQAVSSCLYWVSRHKLWLNFKYRILVNVLHHHFKVAAVYHRRYVQVREVWGGTSSFNNIDNGEDDCEQRAKQRSDIKVHSTTSTPSPSAAPVHFVSQHPIFVSFTSTNFIVIIGWLNSILVNTRINILIHKVSIIWAEDRKSWRGADPIAVWDAFENEGISEPSNFAKMLLTIVVGHWQHPGHSTNSIRPWEARENHDGSCHSV